MTRQKLLSSAFALLFSIIPSVLKAAVPITIKCENNAKIVTDIRVQITPPSGKMIVYEGKDLKSTILEYQLE